MALTARDDILSGVYKDTAAAKQAQNVAMGGHSDVVTLFANFVGYAVANWDYVAQPGAMTAEVLLGSTGRKSPACGTLREALMILIKDEVGTAVNVQPAAVNNTFLVRPGLECFDSKVKGNVGDPGANSVQAYSKGVVFSKHFFLKAGNLYYDPCMKAAYQQETGPVAWNLEGINKPLGLGRRNPPMFTVGMGRAMTVLMNEQYLPNPTTVPGFGSTWVMLSPKECKTHLDADGWKSFKKDPRIKASGLL